MIGDFHVAVSGDYIDDAGLEWLVTADRLYRQHAAVGKDLAEVAVATRIEMLSDDNRGRKVVGEGGDQGEQRVDTARRRSDDHQAREGLAVRLWNLSLVDIIRPVSHGKVSHPRTRQESRHLLRCDEVSHDPFGRFRRVLSGPQSAFILRAMTWRGIGGRV